MLINRQRPGGALFLLLLILSAPVAADNNSQMPLPLANRAPLVAIYGLPLAQSGRVLEASEQQWQLGLTLGNNFRTPARENEAIYLDGETSNARLVWRRGFAKGFEFGVELPVVHHDGGWLDPIIDDYHRLFGFDRAHRDEVPFGEFHYQYSQDGQLKLNLNEAGSGIGDLQLGLGYQLLAQDSRWLAARFSLKAPTGNSDKLYGSGGWDGSAALHWADRQSWSHYRLSYELAAGLLYTSDGDVLAAQRRNLAGFGTALLAWQALPWVNFKLQLDGNTAFYQSALRELDSGSLQLTGGATFRATHRLAIDLGFSEDLVVDTAPDVTLLLAFRYLH